HRSKIEEACLLNNQRRDLYRRRNPSGITVGGSDECTCPTWHSPEYCYSLLFGRRRGLLLLRSFNLLAHRQTQSLLHISLNLAPRLRIVFHRLLGVFAALAQALAFVRETG